MHAPFMRRFRNTRLARMSSGHYCVIRDLGLVKGGKGLRHHEVVLELTWRGVLRFAQSARRLSGTWPEAAETESACEPVLAAQASRPSRG